MLGNKTRQYPALFDCIRMGQLSDSQLMEELKDNTFRTYYQSRMAEEGKPTTLVQDL